MQLNDFICRYCRCGRCRKRICKCRKTRNLVRCADKQFLFDKSLNCIRSAEELDNYSDMVIVVFILCQDMYDNRTLYVDKGSMNRAVEAILGLHCINLL